MTSKKERRYILKRKSKAFLYSIPFYLCRVFKVDKHKLVFWTFEGTGGYGDSPKYIAEEILKINKENGKQYKIYWLMSDTSKYMPPEITKVRDTLWNRAYHMATAGCWVGNSRTFYGTKRRKKQQYVQTWHADICLKPIGRYRGDRFPLIADIVSKADSDLITTVITGSEWAEKMYPEGLIYNRHMFRTGLPRFDVLFNDREKKYMEIRERYHVLADTRLLMYAPTFRGGSQQGKRKISAEKNTVDFKCVLNALEKRFGGNWRVMLRLHPQLAAQKEQLNISDEISHRIIDVTQEPDMNELLAASDAFLTDYSSAMFESMLMYIPSFLYVDDLDEYISDRGILMFDLDELPFPWSKDNQGLSDNILYFNEEKYRERVKKMIDEYKIVIDGQASKKVVEFIEERIDN